MSTGSFNLAVLAQTPQAVSGHSLATMAGLLGFGHRGKAALFRFIPGCPMPMDPLQPRPAW